MKKKVLIIVAVVVAVIGITLAVIAANLGKIVNARKSQMLAEAKALTGRDISVGDVGVTVWRGIGVQANDLVVGDDPAYSSEPFVRAQGLRVNLKILPLLRKQVVVKRFVVVEPAITVIKTPDGRFNFTSLMEAVAPPSQGSAPKPATGAAAVVAFADIENGVVRYVDRATGLDHTVHEIDLRVEDASLDAVIRAELAAAVFTDAQDVRVEAKVGPVGDPTPENLARAPLEVAFTLAPVSFAELARLAPKKSASPPPEGTIEATATVSGTLGAATLDPLAAHATLFGAETPNVDIEASGGPFNLLGDSTAAFAAARFKGSVNARSVPLAAMKLPPPRDPSAAPKLGGELNASATFEGTPLAVTFAGEVDATPATVSQPPQFEKPAGVPAKATVKGTFHAEKTPGAGVDLSSIDIVFHALKATGSGRYVPFKGRESYELSFEARSAIAPWKDLMPALAPFAPTGDVSARVRVGGVPKPGQEPTVKGTATFSKVGATLPNVPEKLHDGAGQAMFTAKTATVSGATFAIGRSAFRLDADVTAFKPLAATYDVTSLEVDRSDVQAAAPNAPKLPRPEVFRNVRARGRLIEKAPKQVENQLEITSGAGVFSNVDYTDFAATLRVLPEVTYIEKYAAKAMGGTVSGKGRFEPKTSKFDVTTKVEQVNLAEYFRYKSPTLADVLVGKIDADFRVAGEGKTWDAVKSTLVGEGGALVMEGAFLNVNMMKQIVGGIQSIPMVPASFTQGLQAKNPKLFSENKTAFQKLDGRVKIADGKIQAPDLKLVTPDFAIAGTGWFSFDKKMDLKSTLTLSDKMTNDVVTQFPMAKYLLSPQGRLEAPLALTGAITKPTVGVDVAALSAKAQKSFMQNALPREKVKEGVKQGMKDVLGGIGRSKEAPKVPADTSKAKPR